MSLSSCLCFHYSHRCSRNKREKRGEFIEEMIYGQVAIADRSVDAVPSSSNVSILMTVHVHSPFSEVGRES